MGTVCRFGFFLLCWRLSVCNGDACIVELNRPLRRVGEFDCDLLKVLQASCVGLMIWF